MPSRQIAGLARRIALPIVTGVGASQAVACTIFGIAKGRCIDDIGARRTRPVRRYAIVPDIGGVLNDLARRSTIAGRRLSGHTPITIVGRRGGRGDTLARSIADLIDALCLLHVTHGGGIVMVQFAHQVAIPGVGLACIRAGRSGRDPGGWTDCSIGIVCLFEQGCAIRVIVRVLDILDHEPRY